MITVSEAARLLEQAAAILAGEEKHLCEIDAETGDGDHGIAISRVAGAIQRVSQDGTYASLEEYFSAISSAVMSINGGSCIPLWANMFDGMAEAAAECTGDTAAGLKRVFQGALEGIRLISDAKPGEKTMVDALAPAVRSAQSCPGGALEILSSAAQAAEEGATATRDMVARFGRAKNLKEDSRGHLDAGAVSVSIFLGAISRCAGNQNQGG